MGPPAEMSIESLEIVKKRFVAASLAGLALK